MEEGFSPVIRAIRKWEPEVRKQLRKELRASGQMIVAGSRLLAGAHSTTIPATIKVRTRIQSRKAEIEIRAGSAEVPIAGLFELGNKGGSKSQAATGRGQFRHPLFGDREQWVNQDMHPFLAPVVKLRIPAVTLRVGAAIDQANEAVGL
jgi:hypothetical protein